MKKKLLSAVLVSAMLAGTLAGCGSGGGVNSTPTDNGGSADTGSDVSADGGASEAAQTDEGQVINIYSFNDELRNRITAVYSAIENTSDDGTVSLFPTSRL